MHLLCDEFRDVLPDIFEKNLSLIDLANLRLVCKKTKCIVDNRIGTSVWSMSENNLHQWAILRRDKTFFLKIDEFYRSRTQKHNLANIFKIFSNFVYGSLPFSDMLYMIQDFCYLDMKRIFDFSVETMTKSVIRIQSWLDHKNLEMIRHNEKLYYSFFLIGKYTEQHYVNIPLKTNEKIVQDIERLFLRHDGDVSFGRNIYITSLICTGDLIKISDYFRHHSKNISMYHYTLCLSSALVSKSFETVKYILELRPLRDQNIYDVDMFHNDGVSLFDQIFFFFYNGMFRKKHKLSDQQFDFVVEYLTKTFRFKYHIPCLFFYILRYRDIPQFFSYSTIMTQNLEYKADQCIFLFNKFENIFSTHHIIPYHEEISLFQKCTKKFLYKHCPVIRTMTLGVQCEWIKHFITHGYYHLIDKYLFNVENYHIVSRELFKEDIFNSHYEDGTAYFWDMLPYFFNYKSAKDRQTSLNFTKNF